MFLMSFYFPDQVNALQHSVWCLYDTVRSKLEMWSAVRAVRWVRGDLRGMCPGAGSTARRAYRLEEVSNGLSQGYILCLIFQTIFIALCVCVGSVF